MACEKQFLNQALKSKSITRAVETTKSRFLVENLKRTEKIHRKECTSTLVPAPSTDLWDQTEITRHIPFYGSNDAFDRSSAYQLQVFNNSKSKVFKQVTNNSYSIEKIEKAQCTPIINKASEKIARVAIPKASEPQSLQKCENLGYYSDLYLKSNNKQVSTDFQNSSSTTNLTVKNKERKLKKKLASHVKVPAIKDKKYSEKSRVVVSDKLVTQSNNKAISNLNAENQFVKKKNTTNSSLLLDDCRAFKFKIGSRKGVTYSDRAIAKDHINTATLGGAVVTMNNDTLSNDYITGCLNKGKKKQKINSTRKHKEKIKAKKSIKKRESTMSEDTELRLAMEFPQHNWLVKHLRKENKLKDSNQVVATSAHSKWSTTKVAEKRDQLQSISLKFLEKETTHNCVEITTSVTNITPTSTTYSFNEGPRNTIGIVKPFQYITKQSPKAVVRHHAAAFQSNDSGYVTDENNTCSMKKSLCNLITNVAHHDVRSSVAAGLKVEAFRSSDDHDKPLDLTSKPTATEVGGVLDLSNKTHVSQVQPKTPFNHKESITKPYKDVTDTSCDIQSGSTGSAVIPPSAGSVECVHNTIRATATAFVTPPSTKTLTGINSFNQATLQITKKAITNHSTEDNNSNRDWKRFSEDCPNTSSEMFQHISVDPVVNGSSSSRLCTYENNAGLLLPVTTSYPSLSSNTKLSFTTLTSRTNNRARYPCDGTKVKKEAGKHNECTIKKEAATVKKAGIQRIKKNPVNVFPTTDTFFRITPDSIPRHSSGRRVSHPAIITTTCYKTEKCQKSLSPKMQNMSSKSFESGQRIDNKYFTTHRQQHHARTSSLSAQDKHNLIGINHNIQSQMQNNFENHRNHETAVEPHMPSFLQSSVYSSLGLCPPLINIGDYNQVKQATGAIRLTNQQSITTRNFSSTVPDSFAVQPYLHKLRFAIKPMPHRFKNSPEAPLYGSITAVQSNPFLPLQRKARRPYLSKPVVRAPPGGVSINSMPIKCTDSPTEKHLPSTYGNSSALGKLPYPPLMNKCFPPITQAAFSSDVKEMFAPQLKPRQIEVESDIRTVAALQKQVHSSVYQSPNSVFQGCDKINLQMNRARKRKSEVFYQNSANSPDFRFYQSYNEKLSNKMPRVPLQVENSQKEKVVTKGAACIVCCNQAYFVCSGCRKPWYCSTSCQAQDWNKHSKICWTYSQVVQN